MRVAYFPKNPEEISIFAPEFRRQGIDFQAFYPNDVWLDGLQSPTVGAGPSLSIKDLESPKIADKSFSDFDLVFQRSVWSWNQIYGPDIVQFFFEVLSLSEPEVKIVNMPRPTLLARRKHMALTVLSRKGMPVLPYYASPSPVRNMITTERIHPPVILKTLEGAAGIGVLLAPDQAVTGDIISLFYRNRDVPIIQPYAPSEHDLRVFVLGGDILGTIRREGKLHKHNISLGAKPIYVPPSKLSHEVSEHAIQASEILDLDIAGVDFIQYEGHYSILEVNPSPGFSGLSSSSGINVPRLISKYLTLSSRS